jgi:prolipoprotein diacylglyceryltransferase
MLPIPVFPTSLYEAVISILLFFVLWIARSKFKYALQLTGLYLLLNGAERFLMEQIKVNYKYDLSGIRIAQSEMISLLLMMGGITLLILAKKKLLASPS